MKFWLRVLCAALFVTAPPLHAQMTQDTTYTKGPDKGNPDFIYNHSFTLTRKDSTLGIVLQGNARAGSCANVWCALVPGGYPPYSNGSIGTYGQSGGTFSSFDAAAHEIVRVWNLIHLSTFTPTPVVVPPDTTPPVVVPPVDTSYSTVRISPTPTGAVTAYTVLRGATVLGRAIQAPAGKWTAYKTASNTPLAPVYTTLTAARQRLIDEFHGVTPPPVDTVSADTVVRTVRISPTPAGAITAYTVLRGDKVLGRVVQAPRGQWTAYANGSTAPVAPAFATLSAATARLVLGGPVVVPPVDTIRVHVTIYDTTHVAVTKYDTTHVPVTKYDTTITHVPVTKYDTTHVPVTKYDTTHKAITVFDTTHVPVVRYDTTVTRVPVTKYDTTHVAVTKYDTTHVPVTVYDTVRVISTRDTIWMKPGDSLSLQQGDIIAIPIRVIDTLAYAGDTLRVPIAVAGNPPAVCTDSTIFADNGAPNTAQNLAVFQCQRYIGRVLYSPSTTLPDATPWIAFKRLSRMTTGRFKSQFDAMQSLNAFPPPVVVPPTGTLKIDDTQYGSQRGEMNVYQDTTYLGRLAYQTNINGTRSWIAYKAGVGGMNRLPAYYADSLTAMKALAGQAVDSVAPPAAGAAEMPRTVMDSRLPAEYFATRQVFDLVGKTLVARLDSLGRTVCNRIVVVDSAGSKWEKPTYFPCGTLQVKRPVAPKTNAKKPTAKKMPVRKSSGTKGRVDVRTSSPCGAGPCESMR